MSDQSQITQRVMDWETLATLPEAPVAHHVPPKAPEPTSHDLFRNEIERCGTGLEGVWKGSGRPKAVFDHLTDIKAIRDAMGLSQKDIGRLVGLLLGHTPYTKNSVSAWEWWSKNVGHLRGERRRAMTKKYAPTSAVMAAYTEIVSELARVVVPRCAGARARLSGASFRFELRVRCRGCEKLFTPEHSRIVNCRRCRR